MTISHAGAVVAALLFSVCAAGQPVSRGVFEDHSDVGEVLRAGSTEYDPAQQTYTVSGSGENMWLATDAFQFAWKKVSGDVTLTADVSFIGAGKEAHRKAVLMIRQTLDADSAYADVARHGDGLTSLQARDENGAITTEIQAAMRAPTRLRITKAGEYFYISLGPAGGDLTFAGGSMRVPIHDPFYVGIGVCSHNKDVVEKAVFSNVEMTPAPASAPPPGLYSTLEVVPVGGDRRAVYVAPGRLSGAWTADGSSLTVHRDGYAKQIPVGDGQAVPEKPPAGDFVYTHSDRSSALQIWRTRSDGSQAEQITSDSFQNCFPHVSPDGQLIAFLSFTGPPRIPQDVEVMLRVLSLSDHKTRMLAKLIGGPDTLGAQPWSPDSRRIAFVSYQPAVPASVASAADEWGPLKFLIGKWTGEGSGQPGSGAGSFAMLPDLQGKVLVRKSFAEYPPADGKPGFRHDDLMIVYREENSGDLRATYYDSEGHTIPYLVEAVEGGAAFISQGPPSATRFRLTYVADGKQRARLTFEIAPPGKEFAPYIQAALRREP